MKGHQWSFLSGVALTVAAVIFLGAGGVVKSPTGIAEDRYVYYPGTEELGKEEIRLIALGTGMPAARHGQAATSFLIEAGNGDKFLFDVGTGSMANAAAMMIPYDYLDKVFLTHLHTDHWGDLDALWAGGWTAGRSEALKVWARLRVGGWRIQWRVGLLSQQTSRQGRYVLSD